MCTIIIASTTLSNFRSNSHDGTYNANLDPKSPYSPLSYDSLVHSINRQKTQSQFSNFPKIPDHFRNPITTNNNLSTHACNHYHQPLDYITHNPSSANGPHPRLHHSSPSPTPTRNNTHVRRGPRTPSTSHQSQPSTKPRETS